MTSASRVVAFTYGSTARRKSSDANAFASRAAPGADTSVNNGSTTQRTSPVQVSSLTSVTAIAGGGSHSLAAKSDTTFRGQVAAAIHLIVHVSRLGTGERRLMSVAEITGHDDRGMLLKELFSYDVDARVHRDLRKAA